MMLIRLLFTMCLVLAFTGCKKMEEAPAPAPVAIPHQTPAEEKFYVPSHENLKKLESPGMGIPADRGKSPGMRIPHKGDKTEP